MSKIDDYKQKANDAGRIKASAAYALGKDSPNNDKHTAICSFVRIVDASFSPMLMSIDCSYGYYGNSSGYSCTSPLLGKYLAQAITEYMPTLLDRACAIANKVAEQARKEAEDEAKSVLNEVTP